MTLLLLTDAVRRPTDAGLAQVLRARFGALDGVELELPARTQPPRAAPPS